MLAIILAVGLALSPTEQLYFRLGVPISSIRMQRIQSTIASSRKISASVFTDPALLDRRVAVLETEVGPNAARLMLLRSPLLLATELESTLPARMAMLRRLLPKTDAPGVLVRAPALLMLTEETLEARVAALEALLPKGTMSSTVVGRAPTLLQLASLDARLEALDALVPGLDRRKLVARAPSLLAYDPKALSAKLDQLSALFGPKLDAAAIVKREPRLLTLHIDSIADKLACYETQLPGLDVRKLLASTPSLLSYDVRKTLPAKLKALEGVLPGADVPRLVRLVPQLLEYATCCCLLLLLLAVASLSSSSTL